ncbi:MAG: hydroxyacid dehydrogenase [Rhodospirillales bacterium RIFCSPLOWO2_12_FULL_67_15]|nr:MAG: hydroxyacid dehydrogenase [Rhodospirillales bacterium RIFCSPLOWO2_12_FULL_67_15]
MKVVFQYDAGPGLRRRLEALAAEGFVVVPCEETDRTRFRALLADADVLWHILMPITAEVIAAAPKLRLIQKVGVGVNTIDLAAASARGIAVCNMPGTNSRAVAEMTLLLMLAALRKICWFDRKTREGRGWPLPPEIQDALGEIAGRTVGLVGYGAVPRLLAPVLRAMGAKVLYTARTAKPDAVAEWRTLADLLAESDVVSLHAALSEKTEGLIGAQALARMKPGAVLVNTARGALVDEPALAAALRSGRLGAAGLDVFAAEPAGPGHPLFALPNVVLAPHVAWLTMETLERSLAVAVENCRRLRAGTPLLHRVV